MLKVLIFPCKKFWLHSIARLWKLIPTVYYIQFLMTLNTTSSKCCEVLMVVTNVFSFHRPTDEEAEQLLAVDDQSSTSHTCRSALCLPVLLQTAGVPYPRQVHTLTLILHLNNDLKIKMVMSYFN